MFPFPWDPIKFPKIHLYDSCWTTEGFLDQSFTKQLPRTWIIWLLFLCFLDLCSVLPIIEWPDSYTLFQKRPSSCLTECQSNNVCGLYTVAFHIQPQNLVCLCYCCQMFCGWFSGLLWWMSPCQWISANLSNFEMILFSAWLSSSQTKPCCHLKLPSFGYLFFTLNHRATCYRFLWGNLFNSISPLSGFFLIAWFTGNSYLHSPALRVWGIRLGVLSSEVSSLLELRLEESLSFFLEMKQGEGTTCKRILMFSPLFFLQICWQHRNTTACCSCSALTSQWNSPRKQQGGSSSTLLRQDQPYTHGLRN